MRKPSMPLPRQAHAPRDSTSRYPRRRPTPRDLRRVMSSHRLRFPFRVLPMLHRSSQCLVPMISKLTLDSMPYRYYLPRFVPLQRFSVARSYLTSSGFHPPVRLRPQGFAPSRRFLPRATLRAYFISLPLLGFPFEALFRPQRRTLSRTPGPSWLAPHRVLPRYLGSTQGFTHAARSPPVALGFSQWATSVPPWAFLFEVCYPRQPIVFRKRNHHHPLSFFTAAAFTLATAAEPQGVGLSLARPISLETDHPP